MKTDVLIIEQVQPDWRCCQLIRYGIDFVIIEQREGVTAYSKALGVHARTLEIYEQLGLAQQVEQGRSPESADAQKWRSTCRTRFVEPWHRFDGVPFVLFLEQSKMSSCSMTI